MLIVGRNHFIAEIFCLLLKLLLNNGPFNNQTGLDHLKLLPSEALLTSNFTMDAEAQALLNAAREAQVDLMVRNDVSKLPLWFGVPAKDTITGRQWVAQVECSIVATRWNDVP